MSAEILPAFSYMVERYESIFAEVLGIAVVLDTGDTG
jgi:hypothetical protein